MNNASEKKRVLAGACGLFLGAEIIVSTYDLDAEIQTIATAIAVVVVLASLSLISYGGYKIFCRADDEPPPVLPTSVAPHPRKEVIMQAIPSLPEVLADIIIEYDRELLGLAQEFRQIFANKFSQNTFFSDQLSSAVRILEDFALQRHNDKDAVVRNFFAKNAWNSCDHPERSLLEYLEYNDNLAQFVVPTRNWLNTLAHMLEIEPSRSEIPGHTV